MPLSSLKWMCAAQVSVDHRHWLPVTSVDDRMAARRVAVATARLMAEDLDCVVYARVIVETVVEVGWCSAGSVIDRYTAIPRSMLPRTTPMRNLPALGGYDPSLWVSLGHGRAGGRGCRRKNNIDHRSFKEGW